MGGYCIVNQANGSFCIADMELRNLRTASRLLVAQLSPEQQ
jgi:hypothetical protein